MKSLSRPTLIELLRLLMQHTGASVIPCSILAVLMFASLRNDQNQALLGLWTVTIIAIKLITAQYSKYRLKQTFDASDISPIITELAILNFIDALAWGSLVWITLDTASVSGSIMIITVQAAITGGSMTSLAPVWQIYALFMLTSLAMLAVKLSLTQDPVYGVLTIAAVLYAITLIEQARNSHLAAKNAIELRFTNLSLIEQLRLESESAYRAQEQAKTATQAKSQFLAAASHDLRQPVHAQTLFLGALARSELTPWQRKTLEQTQASSHTMASMLNTLLDASRIEAGAITPYITNFRLQPILQKLEVELSTLADAKDLFYRSRDSQHTLKSDPVLLEQILRNLIANAISYTNKGGILIGCRQRRDSIVIEVWDTGIGIAPELFDKIFIEFFQAANPERDRKKGFGLGLPIARGLAQTLGHTLSFHSVPDKGSCFSIRVPIARDVILETPDIITSTTKNQSSLPLTVLIIDDDKDVRDAMQTLLSLWGCTCLVADNLPSAMALVMLNTPDIIISDYRLRDNQTGAQVIAALRQVISPTTPALLITGDISPHRLQEAMATGIPLLHKPVSATHLYEAIVQAAHVTTP